MQEINNDIKNAINIIESGVTNKFSRYNRIYLFATENINGYLNNINENKNILSICGSGDQAISFMLKNPKNINVFDINVLSKYILFLKISAIKYLDYQSFLDFFIYKKFNYNIFKKINLNQDIFTFWNELYKYFNFDGNKIYDNLFIKNNEEFYFKNIPYLNNNYNFIKNNILNIEINFINCNLYDIDKYINTKQNIIYLSNISDYIENIIEFNNYINSLKNKFNCKIIMSYLYDFSIKNKYINDINNPDFINKHIDNCQLYKFNGAYKKTIDCILVKE